MKTYPIKQIFCGKIQQRYGLTTAINRSPVHTPTHLTFNGLEGDEFGSPHHHGGPDRALHHYPLEHYIYWSSHYKKLRWCAPGMGENISTTGMTERTVCLGDKYQWGDAIIEVSQPRSPCYKLNKRWNIPGLSTQMQENHRCGWLYRVIQEGIVSKHMPLILTAQANDPITLHEVCQLFFDAPLQQEGLSRLSQQTSLSDSWMNKVIERQQTRHIENWSFRLNGE